MEIDDKNYLNIFREVGNAFNSPMDTKEVLQVITKTIVKNFSLKGCHYLLLSQDQKNLEHISSYGLSEKFMKIFQKGMLDAEKSVSEALRGNMVFIEDVTKDPRIQYPKEHEEEGIVSLLTVPLVSRGNVIGSMRLSTSEKKIFTPHELEIINVVAEFTTSAIIHSIFHGILGRVTETVQSSLDIDEVLESIVKVITEELRAKGCTIRLLDTEGKKLLLKASYGLSSDYLNKGPVDADKSIAEALEGKCVAIRDLTTDPRAQYPDEARKEGISSLLTVPLLIRKKSIGVLRLYTYHEYEFSEDEIYLIHSISNQCALAIQNAQMYTGMKHRYDVLMSDFHKWFDEFQSTPT